VKSLPCYGFAPLDVDGVQAHAGDVLEDTSYPVEDASRFHLVTIEGHGKGRSLVSRDGNNNCCMIRDEYRNLGPFWRQEEGGELERKGWMFDWSAHVYMEAFGVCRALLEFLRSIDIDEARKIYAKFVFHYAGEWK
jgi:hypothetical protein